MKACKDEDRCRIIGIAGGSASGKTSVANELSKLLNAPVISLDSFYKDQSTLPLSERAKQNYDQPQAFEVPLLVQSLSDLKRSGHVSIPVYSFSEHTRLKQKTTINANGVVILEGIFVIAFPEVRQQLSIAVFIDTPADVRFSRRLVRDTAERGRSAESVKQQWEMTVEAGYQEYCYPSMTYADLRISGLQPQKKSAEQILAALQSC